MDTKTYASKVSIPLSTIAVILKPILLIIALLYSVMAYFNPLMLPLVFIVAGLFIWLQFFCGKDDYIYTLTQKDFSIERVSKKGRCKSKKTFTANEILLLAPSRSTYLNQYIENGKKVFMVDYTSRIHSEKEYVLVCDKDAKKRMILLELDDEMLEGFSKLFPAITKRKDTAPKEPDNM